jgi:hypothetical protein
MLKLLPLIIFAACATTKAAPTKKVITTEQGVEIVSEKNQKIITNK